MRRVYLPCKDCNRIVLVYGPKQKGDFVECPHGLTQSREPFPATVYYENAAGQRLYPWDHRELPKEYTDKGFQRFEVSGFERGRFEKQTRAQMNAEASHKSEDARREYEEDRAQRHAELRNMAQGWDDKHRAIAYEAMEQEDRGYSRQHDSEFHIGRD